MCSGESSPRSIDDTVAPMKLIASVLALLVLTISQITSAQVVTLLDDGAPSVSVEYPDGWQIRTPRKKGGNIIAAMPDDGSLLWQGLWILRETDSIDQARQRLGAMESRLFTDVKQTKDPWQAQIGELTVYNQEGTGLYQGSMPITVFMTLFLVPGQRVAALVYMGDPAAIDEHHSDLAFIVQSLQLDHP